MNTKKLKGFEDIENQFDSEGEWIEPEVTVESIRPKFWMLRRPIAASSDTWDDWEKLAKQHFPVRHWIQEDLAFWISFQWRKVSNALWWVRYRTTDRNHIFKFDSLEPGYYDTRELILHASFDMFSRFMKFQHSDDAIVDWTGEFHIEEWTEMNEIWEWWKARDGREERWEKENPSPNVPGGLSILSKRTENEPIMIEYRDWLKRYSEKDVALEKEDEEMLIRLAKVRTALWD